MENTYTEDKEKRNNKRIEISGVLFISGFDGHDNLVAQDIGVLKNISKSGVMILLYHKFDYNIVKLSGSKVDGTPIEIKGTVVYSRNINENNIYVGIQFSGNEQDNIVFVREIVKNYHYQKTITKVRKHNTCDQ